MTKGLIDMHCHLLPGVDDGASTVEETVRMLGMAHKTGTDTIIVTPHYHEGRYKPTKEKVIKRFKQVKRIVDLTNNSFRLYLGQEIYYQQDTVARLDAGEILTMADSSYVLIEFSTHTSYNGIKQAFQSIQLGGYVPILAHVERYESLSGEKNLVEELVQMGVYIQVNASSLIHGTYKTKKFLKTLLKEGLVHLVASDAHNLEGRPPVLKDAYRHLAGKYGKETADALLIENPERIIKNEYI